MKTGESSGEMVPLNNFKNQSGKSHQTIINAIYFKWISSAVLAFSKYTLVEYSPKTKKNSLL
jgi:hypothetical protein